MIVRLAFMQWFEGGSEKWWMAKGQVGLKTTGSWKLGVRELCYYETHMFSVFFCLSVKEIAESIYFPKSSLFSICACVAASNSNKPLKWADKFEWFELAGRRLLKFWILYFDFDFKFTEIEMSQLVSSGDSIKIWDTSTYDCIYDWPSPGNTTGEWVQCFDC